MDNLNSILTALKHGTDNLAAEICAKKGYRTPYTIAFKNLDNLVTKNELPDDIVISAGNPVNIIMSQSFVLWCLVYEKKLIYRAKLNSALEHMHLVHRTLSHPVPLSKAIALKKEARKWVKTMAPNIPRDISEQYLKISYSITVSDTVSNISITLSGNDPEELKRRAISRLSQQVYENEDFEEMHEQMKEIMRAKKEKISPAEIVIDGSTQAVNVRIGY